LENISFTLPPGKRLGLAGGVGSGKSTLLACLARMEPVPRGTIFFDGIDVLDLPLTEVRRRIAFVPQESFLFSRSIEENVLYGSSDLDSAPAETKRTRTKEATRLASVDADVERLSGNYNTMLGERGVNLSGGQRQRLSIARAIARQPQILLLDDCMSAIDAETERSLVGGLVEASSGISLILASHRSSSFAHMDWLILLENGRISEQGKAAELLQNKNLHEIARKAELERMDLLK
jgi:ATP-binding cassette subfamily B protein